jgi:UDP-3-O-[3-hydroxymyristoyl] glucosamine N-acyltransferase LpxD
VTIRASDIAKFLNAPLKGPELELRGPKSLVSADRNTVVFMSKATDVAIDRINGIEAILCITTNPISDRLSCSVITVEAPRLAFSQSLNEFFAPKLTAMIDANATVDSAARLSKNVTVGPGCHIGPDVRIGEGSVIGSNVVISGKVDIGANCIVKSNSTVGEPGFGFIRTGDGQSERFPHLGCVEIGDFVEIGANCTVVRATLDATILEPYVKLDDHVHIAHNCHVGYGAFIAAGAILSGSVTIGKNVWIAPNATIIDYGVVDDDAFVGIGSVVTKPVAKSARVFGVPARPIGARPRRKP